MGLLEQQEQTATESERQLPLVAENERLLEEARDERVRHEAILRVADRRIRAGLDVIRRSTLRVVSSK